MLCESSLVAPGSLNAAESLDNEQKADDVEGLCYAIAQQGGRDQDARGGIGEYTVGGALVILVGRLQAGGQLSPLPMPMHDLRAVRPVEREKASSLWLRTLSRGEAQRKTDARSSLRSRRCYMWVLLYRNMCLG